MLLEGVFLPLLTPFHPDGRLFARKLEQNVARYSLTPAAGLVVGLSEAEMLADDEARCVLETATRTAADEKVMIASVGRPSLQRTLALAEVAAKYDYDAVLVGDVSGVAEQEAETYLLMVADRSALPLILDRVAVRRMRRLAGHPNVLGAVASVEETGPLPETSREVTVTGTFAAATGRMLRRASGLVQVGGVGAGAPALKTRKKRVGFQVLESSTARMLPAWRAGASGAMPALGPCAPQSCCEVWQAFKDGDAALAEEKQARLTEAAGLAEDTAAAKYGSDWNGYFGGAPRLPRFAVDAERRAEVERVLAGLRI